MDVNAVTQHGSPLYYLRVKVESLQCVDCVGVFGDVIHCNGSPSIRERGTLHEFLVVRVVQSLHTK